MGRPIGMGRREAGVRGVFGAVVCPAVVGGRRGVRGVVMARGGGSVGGWV